jgi:hypothetical protein
MEVTGGGQGSMEGHVCLGPDADFTDSLDCCYAQWMRRIVSYERIHVCELGRQCRSESPELESGTL